MFRDLANAWKKDTISRYGYTYTTTTTEGETTEVVAKGGVPLATAADWKAAYAASVAPRPAPAAPAKPTRTAYNWQQQYQDEQDEKWMWEQINNDK